MRKSFSMIIAIIFIIVMSIIGVMILKFSAASTTHITRSFMNTRAELMLRSATEYAVLALHGHEINATDGYLEHVNFEDSDNLFDVNITYHYFLTNCSASSKYCSLITTADTNGTVLIYVTVKSKNPDFNIRKVRFTLQNP